MADEGFSLPEDVFVEVLLRLPTSARRRFRLVCKRWRDVVDERTPERQVRTKILTFTSHIPSSRAIVFDDGKDGRRRHEWTFDPSTRGGVVHMVGTCNGLICLHETAVGGSGNNLSAITVANPITGETLPLPLPPLPEAWDTFRHLGLYAFGYHSATGRYKVVHVPSRLARRQDAVHVLTLGDGDPAAAAWRDVVSPDMGGSYNPFCGIVCADGSAYWFASRADRVVALDLDDDERVASFPGPPGVVRPVEAMGEASWKVTNVHARLGVTVSRYEAAAAARAEVWVLDGGGAGGVPPRWSRRYNVVEDVRGRWIVSTPHWTYGEYVLSLSWDRRRLYRRKVGECTNVEDGRTTELRPLEEETDEEESDEEEEEDAAAVVGRTFAYVETREPLRVSADEHELRHGVRQA